MISVIRSFQEAAVPTVALNNGIAIPIVGYGVFQIPDSQSVPAASSTPFTPGIA
jgi:diketogulonate reductase-like aldo/keto reductase